MMPSLSQPQRMMGAVLFLTFPAAVEPVTWAAGVFDVALVTCTLAFLLALTSEGTGFRGSAMIALCAGLLCKETAVAIPVLGVTVLLLRPVHVRTVAVSVAIAALYIAVRLLYVDAPTNNDAPLGYFVKEMLSRPFASLGSPWTLAELKNYPLLGVLPQTLVAALLVGYAFFGKDGFRPAVLAIWIVMGVAPLLGYLFIGDHLENSRYLYLPLVGWSLLLSSLSGWNIKSPYLAAPLIGLCIVSLLGAIGVMWHQRPWTAAAATRDTVLTAAKSAMVMADCESASFTHLPDNVSGAYVFRNGFTQAARMADINVNTGSNGNLRCTFAWNGHSFTVGGP